jgi:processive 1,2-diacylglycerol beta-glucosyltransferase
VKRIDLLEIDQDFHIYVVCGNNAEAKEEVCALEGIMKHSMTVVGFVNNISTVMDASDCIVTKPGGLTTSESLAKGLPMVIVNPIPGQEQRNTEFLVSQGAAVWASKSFPIEECLYGLLSSDARLGAMVQCVEELAKPNSSKDVCSFVIDLMYTPSIDREIANEE